MNEQLLELTETYRKAGDDILAVLQKSIVQAGGFVNASNNKQEKKDMRCMVFNSAKGYTETYPIRALRVSEDGSVQVYVGTFGTIYTDNYLRGKASQEHWMPLKGSNIIFYQTILSIAAHIDDYLPQA